VISPPPLPPKREQLLENPLPPQHLASVTDTSPEHQPASSTEDLEIPRQKREQLLEHPPADAPRHLGACVPASLEHEPASTKAKDLEIPWQLTNWTNQLLEEERHEPSSTGGGDVSNWTHFASFNQEQFVTTPTVLTNSVFSCEYDCGFEGEFDEVSSHESTCKHNPSTDKKV